MAKKPWGGAGAWAVDSELAENQLEQEEPQYHHQQASPLFAGDAAFPSLGEAAHSKTKKKKQQPVSLAKFMAGGSPLLSDSKGLTIEEKMALPTGPRDRSGEEEPHGGLGGGFRDYGGYRGEGRDRDYGRDREGGFGSRRSDREGGFGKGGFTGDRDGPEEPSRADIADDWGASKKSAPPSRGRYEGGGRFDDREFPSKADDDSHWGASKKFVPAPPANGASRRVSKYDFSSARNGAPLDSSDSESWAASKKAVSSGGYNVTGQRDRDFWNAREKDGMDSDTWARREADRATERPRLVLQPRSQRSDSSPPPPSKEDTENRPPSSELPPEQPSKPHKVNPFGEAKPREVILEEKGMNWKKLDAKLELKASDRGDGLELALKDEIKELQDALKLAEADGANEEENSEGVAELKEQLLQKEGELEQLRATSSDKSGEFWGGADRAGSRKDSNVWSRQPSDGRSTSEKRGGRCGLLYEAS
ncbi:hypothetical protein GOP47_0029779 [Adiantum capillus-veneris]|nr:hypothetical protein GOP47_0029779 [Adiantum capillus-veneris]